MLKWLPILPFAAFITLMSCSRTDPVDAAVTPGAAPVETVRQG